MNLPMRELHEGWTEIDDGNITVYITSMKNDTPICFCFRLDKEQTDKISFLKFVEIDDEKSLPNNPPPYPTNTK